MPGREAWGPPPRTQAGDSSGELGVGCCWLSGLRARLSSLAGGRLQEPPRVCESGSRRGQGRANDLGAVPLTARAEAPTPSTRGASRGRWVCVHGDFVTPALLPAPQSSPEPSGARLRHFVFLNRSHLHTTFSFIKTRRSWGRAGSAQLSTGSVRLGPCSSRSAGAARGVPVRVSVCACTHARVGWHTRPAVSGQLWGRIRSVCSEGGRECAGSALLVCL